MKINEVTVSNWYPPGDKWWAGVEARPTEPLIEATIGITLSWAEYRELLDRNEHQPMKQPRTLEKMETVAPTGSAWYPLFEHMSKEHGLTLLDDELNSIASKADESRLKPAGLALPIPQALYSCYSCREDYSWPPQDLRWSAKVKEWVCDMCRDEGHGEPGPRLSEVLRRQTIDYTT